jgi:hypothetical protein
MLHQNSTRSAFSVDNGAITLRSGGCPIVAGETAENGKLFVADADDSRRPDRIAAFILPSIECIATGCHLDCAS